VSAQTAEPAASDQNPEAAAAATNSSSSHLKDKNSNSKSYHHVLANNAIRIGGVSAAGDKAASTSNGVIPGLHVPGAGDDDDEDEDDLSVISNDSATTIEVLHGGWPAAAQKTSSSRINSAPKTGRTSSLFTTGGGYGGGHHIASKTNDSFEPTITQFSKPRCFSVPQANGGSHLILKKMSSNNKVRDAVIEVTPPPPPNNCHAPQSQREAAADNIGDGGGKRNDQLPNSNKLGYNQRLVMKNGNYNVELANVSKIKAAFFKDIFTTVVDMRWRYTILSFVSSFLTTWLFFAVIWYLIVWSHGDLLEHHLPGSPAQANGSWIPCVWQIKSFTSCFLFSIETQHTIGYGSRATSEECPHAIIIMCVQSIIGVLSSTCMAGIVFAKLARPKRRAHTIAFSKNAVVSLRNGWLFLLFRIGNLRTKSHIIESHVTVQMVECKKSTKEGETIAFSQQDLKVSTQLEEDEHDQCLMAVPNTVCHKIDEESPFYAMSPDELLRAKFELVVVLEGVVESTGNTVQARTSYLPREIIWGHRFESMISYANSRGRYVVDCSYLNAIIEDESTPRKSMQDIAMLEADDEASAP